MSCNSHKIKETKGKTPERTVIAVMLIDTHNVFVRVGDGLFGLTKLKEQCSAKT